METDTGYKALYPESVTLRRSTLSKSIEGRTWKSRCRCKKRLRNGGFERPHKGRPRTPATCRMRLSMDTDNARINSLAKLNIITIRYPRTTLLVSRSIVSSTILHVAVFRQRHRKGRLILPIIAFPTALRLDLIRRALLLI